MDTNKDSSSWFTDRIKKIISLVGSAEKLASNSGITASAISQYLSGKTDPSRTRLIALATAAGVNIEWLTTGQGPMRIEDRERFNLELLTLIIGCLDDYERSLKEKLTANEKANLISYTYDLCFDEDLASDQIKNLIMDTLKAIDDLFNSLDRMIKTEKGQEQALKIFTKEFEKILSKEEAEYEARELIASRYYKLRLK